MKDNIDRVIEAIDYPERFSDAEIAEMLHGPSAREFYEMMSRASDALSKTPQPDIDREWTEFAANRFPTRNAVKYLFGSRKAAAVALIAVASLAVVAATVGITRSFFRDEEPSMEAIADDGKPTTITDAGIVTDSIEVPVAKPDEVVVFRNETFGNIISTIGKHYGATVNFNDVESKNLRLYFRWDKSDSLTEIVEQLNIFERITIRVSGAVIIVE